MEQTGANGAQLRHVVYNGYKTEMNKKFVMIVFGVIIVIAVVAFFLVRQNTSNVGGGGGTTGTLPPVSTSTGGTTGTLPPVSTSTTTNTPPPGSTITLGTSHGNVTTNNFYKSADYITQDQQTVVIQQAPTYSIVYNVSDSSFIISILSAPLEAARQAAETAFLNSLGISQKDACALNVYEGVPASVSNKYIGEPFPLSFCGNSTAL